ncbi:MAG: DUF2089 domain-containing protein [Candidatus Bipolaricaulota bacterium]|nr:DUF2089 domain-containing protein [Candidatus Bipolaricaulota bacterium]MBS3793156.1 DUF2089 domain-containing protein [Candidatus Bipolaricaulota bacterium]
MANKIIGQCPVCGSDMKVTELECSNCNTKVSGRFDLGQFAQLTPDQLEFVEIFIRLRGNIKDVEEEMGISYPTVRKKLDDVIESMGYSPGETADEEVAEKRNKVLNSLDEGEIDFEEAKKRLQEL